MENSPPSPLPVNKRSVPARGRRSTSLVARLSTRNLYELQLKSSNYDAMMQRFQLRKVSDSKAAGSKLQHAVIDTVLGKKSTSGWLSPRNFLALTRAKTWRRVWKAATSPIAPESGISIFHELCMCAVAQFQLFYVPFSYMYIPSGSSETIRVGLALQLVHLADLLLTLNTAFMKKNKLVTSRSAIFRNHASKWFALELVSAVPVGFAFSFESNGSADTPMILLHYDSMLMVLRTLLNVVGDQGLLPLRALQHNKTVSSWFLYSRYSHLLGIAKLLWIILLVAHYMACLWHAVSGQHSHTTRGVGEKYMEDFYYSVQLIQGQGGVTGTWQENFLSTVVILTGSVILAVVFGNVALLVSNFNANTTKYQQKMEGVFATMDKMALPLKLRECVHQYYAHVWTEYESLDGDIVKFQRELAHTLGLEVGLYKYMNLVTKISFWESCSPDFATQIIKNMEVRVYLPDDYVVRKGETGDEMFMINRGICELSDPAESQKPNVAILASGRDGRSGHSDLASAAAIEDTSDSSEDNEEGEDIKQDHDHQTRKKAIFHRGAIGADTKKQVYPVKSNYFFELNSSQRLLTAKKQILLYPGQAFGEMSLLMNYKRTANIRAVTYVEICIFNRASFQRIISRYPEDRRQVLTMMLRSCIEKKEIPFPWEEVVDAVAERRRRIGSPQLSLHDTVTSTEAAQALVDKIDVNRPDESIKYGFQTFHEDLQGTTSREDSNNRTSSEPSLRRLSFGSCPCSSSGGGDHSRANNGVPRTSPSNDALDKKIDSMMNIITKMAASIERLENRDASCCKRCLATSTPLYAVDVQAEKMETMKSDNTCGAEEEDGTDEAREAGLTRSSRPRKRVSRRNTTCDVVPEPEKRRSTVTRTMSDESRADQGTIPQAIHSARIVARSQNRKSPASTEQARARSRTDSPQDPPAHQATNVPRQPSSVEFPPEACDPTLSEAPQATRRGLSSLSSESLFGGRRVDRSSWTSRTSTENDKPVAVPDQLHVRSSLPSKSEGLSNALSRPDAGGDNLLQGHHTQPTKGKRRGSRIGIDAFETAILDSGQVFSTPTDNYCG